ncbi:MAG: GNAT family N-acetyltransferase [Acidobacteriia bacterium]|nr:GNAT family N-acetyltransferase [Terriglobia bacterium]
MDIGRGEPLIRSLKADDCARLVRMDQEISGRNRRAWYEGKTRRALEESDVRISLGADVDGSLVGALLGSVHYGEFGQPEPVAILDTLLVDPAFARRGIATAMLRQLLQNLSALRIERLRTEVAWNELDLMAFFERAGFAPVPRLVLELPVPAAR